MKVFNREIKLSGTVKNGLRVLARDFEGKVLICSGTVVPTGAGYAKGALFMKTDVVTGSKGLYENQGTTAAASFNVIGDVSTAEIANAGVTLAKLATGILPSHVVKFFVLGSTITTTALTGLAVGDLIVSILANGTVTVATCATINTLPADPADTTYLIVFRAAA
jgi:FAD/FMN-containing dehydrogenase